MEYDDEIMRNLVDDLFEAEIPSYDEIWRSKYAEYDFDKFDHHQDWVDVYFDLLKYQQEDPGFMVKTFTYMNIKDTLFNIAAKLDRVDVYQLLDICLLDELLSNKNDLYIKIVTKAYNVSFENYSVRCQAHIWNNVDSIIDESIRERCKEIIDPPYYSLGPLFRSILFLSTDKLYNLIKDNKARRLWIDVNERDLFNDEDDDQVQEIGNCDYCQEIDSSTYTFSAFSYAVMKRKWEHAKLLYLSGADIYEDLVPGCTRRIVDFLQQKMMDSSTPLSIKKFFETEINVHWCFSHLGRAHAALRIKDIEDKSLPCWAKTRIDSGMLLPEVNIDEKEDRIFTFVLELPDDIFNNIQRFLVPSYMCKKYQEMQKE
jgi:hypothetical protein